MSIINDGGPAFPHSEFAIDVTMEDGRRAARVYSPSAGMSLRDWFAGQALRQFLDERDYVNIWAHEKYESCRHEIAKAAYNIADAMIAARNGGKS